MFSPEQSTLLKHSLRSIFPRMKTELYFHFQNKGDIKRVVNGNEWRGVDSFLKSQNWNHNKSPWKSCQERELIEFCNYLQEGYLDSLVSYLFFAVSYILEKTHFLSCDIRYKLCQILHEIDKYFDWCVDYCVPLITYVPHPLIVCSHISFCLYVLYHQLLSVCLLASSEEEE